MDFCLGPRLLSVPSRGRSFNPSTLPGANLPQYLESKARNLDRNTQAPLALNEDSRIGGEESNAAVNGSYFANSTLVDPTKPAANARSVSTLESSAKGNERHERHQESAQQPGQAGGLNSSGQGGDGGQSSSGYPLTTPSDSLKEAGLEKHHEDIGLAQGENDQRN